MLWLTWRQFRAQFLTALAVLVALAIYLVYLGQAIRHSYNTDVLGCLPANGCDLSDAKDRFLNEYGGMVAVASSILIGIPAIIGIFWGAPLITRELETNTHRLAWTQSVTRTRWLAFKLAGIGLVSVALTGGYSLLLTWAASRFDQVQGYRFHAAFFVSRNVVPLGYVVLALVLGTAIGLIVRRTLPAMAATLLVLGVVQLLMPNVVRPNLQAPVTEQIAFTTEGDIPLAVTEGPVEIYDYVIPGAMMLTSLTHLRTESGELVTMPMVEDCLSEAGAEQFRECVAERNYHFEVSYQPAERYWRFQWLELSVLLVPAVLLTGFLLWRIRRVRG